MNLLDGLFPKGRFLTMHPYLVDISDWGGALMMHELGWRGADKPGTWVRHTVAEWSTILRCSDKVMARVIRDLENAGFIDVSPSPGLDRTKQYRLNREAINEAVETVCGDTPEPVDNWRENALPPEGEMGDAVPPLGKLVPPEGRMHYPRREEVVTPEGVFFLIKKKELKTLRNKETCVHANELFDDPEPVDNRGVRPKPAPVRAKALQPIPDQTATTRRTKQGPTAADIERIVDARRIAFELKTSTGTIAAKAAITKAWLWAVDAEPADPAGYLIRSIRGARQNAHYCGLNDTGTVYDGWDSLLRSASRVEDHAEALDSARTPLKLNRTGVAANPAPAPRRTPDTATYRMAAIADKLQARMANTEIVPLQQLERR